MVRATHRKMDQPPEARPGVVNDTAMERRGAQAFSDRNEGREARGQAMDWLKQLEVSK